jgi:signal transduction histidine kinase
VTLPPSPNLITRSAGLALMTIGVIVLAGWVWDIALLKGLFGPITMKGNAAIALLFAGVALRMDGLSRRLWRVVGMLAAVLAGAIGAATLSEHLGGWELGIDQLLFAEPPGAAATTSPGRMGPNASLCLTLSGIALTCIYRSTPRRLLWAQVLGATVAALALVPTVGYLYGATELYAIARYSGIAFHTGVALLVLGIGILGARPNDGPVAALLNDAPHGIIARRLLGVAVSVPLLLGYIRVVGERLGWFDVGLGASLFVVSMIVLLSLTIWRTAVALARTGADLARSEQDRSDLLTRERAAREKAEQADRAKDQFIAALSHELRTPLNAILGWMYMLRNDAVPEPAKGKAAEAVVRNAGLLARLIEDLLDTSRITTGHLALSRTAVDLRVVVQAAIESVLPASEGQGVRVVLDASPELPTLEADAQRLQQVVWNLLSNAIKFSPPGGIVRVQLSAEGEDAIVVVRDQGKGIDPDFLPYVFERFLQADSTAARDQGGLGLGLYIARHLTELHGGTLHAHSDGPGSGAVFTVRLPLDAALSGDGGDHNYPRAVSV